MDSMNCIFGAEITHSGILQTLDMLSVQYANIHRTQVGRQSYILDSSWNHYELECHVFQIPITSETFKVVICIQEKDQTITKGKKYISTM